MFEDYNKITPCHHCKERQPGCHGSCEKYQTWKKNKDEQGARILLELREARPVGGYKK